MNDERYRHLLNDDDGNPLRGARRWVRKVAFLGAVYGATTESLRARYGPEIAEKCQAILGT